MMAAAAAGNAVGTRLLALARRALWDPCEDTEDAARRRASELLDDVRTETEQFVATRGWPADTFFAIFEDTILETGRKRKTLVCCLAGTQKDCREVSYREDPLLKWKNENGLLGTVHDYAWLLGCPDDPSGARHTAVSAPALALGTAYNTACRLLKCADVQAVSELHVPADGDEEGSDGAAAVAALALAAAQDDAP